MKVEPSNAPKAFLIRSENLEADEFGTLFRRMFGNPPPPLRHPIVITGVYGRYEGFSFRRLSFCSDLITELPDMGDEITFIFPSTGRVILEQHGETIGTAHFGLALEKMALRSLGFIDNHSHHGFSVHRSLLTRRLSRLLERPIIQPVRFQRSIDLKIEAFHGIKAIVSMATDSDFYRLIGNSALLPIRLQEMLVDAVLDVWPHNYTEELKRPFPLIAPRHVKRAMDYLQAYPEILISGSELAELCNVSQRALQEGFRRFLGTSISAYQRQVRLQRAYEMIQQGNTSSVADVSLALGFTNAGRFCQYFQNAFGLSPAQLRDGLNRRR
ncbi:helix-turn-helix transcriptional regulator [Pseudomonas sp. JUb52]|uniref:helix-turn-helix transcriptional regulator n=1 Tax=Pseudomonas sp. JUb52 TaxID=2485127 RepID=UPI001046A879|nr:helix-turn-helix transcriptional regulator [Pseudomonas sp. JUb52]TCQ94418.1 AraC family transcriptional regulator [Pseudomonas sp. JUb52]